MPDSRSQTGCDIFRSSAFERRHTVSTDLVSTITTVQVTIPTLDGESIAETVEIEVPCTVDPVTGEEFLTGDALKEIDRTKARHMGLLQPEEIKELRSSLGMTQKQMCEMLQIGAKSYSRWETGRERPTRSMNILLRALLDGKLDAGYLKSLRQPRFDWRDVLKFRRGTRETRQYIIDTSGQPLAGPSHYRDGCYETEQSAA
jgi:putative zinc finger/helix-turn-helix YgiT family protein